jgi:hypothetical protein
LDTKVHIRSGDLEVGCEGSEDFIKQELPKILEIVAGLRRHNAANDSSVLNNPPPGNTRNPKHLSVTTVAAKFACKSGPELVEAGAAKLAVIDGMDDFSRENLLDAIKKATGYYKATYSNNLTVYLNGLIKNQRLLETGEGKFSVPPNVRAEWESKLA